MHTHVYYRIPDFREYIAKMVPIFLVQNATFSQKALADNAERLMVLNGAPFCPYISLRAFKEAASASAGQRPCPIIHHVNSLKPATVPAGHSVV